MTESIDPFTTVLMLMRAVAMQPGIDSEKLVNDFIAAMGEKYPALIEELQKLKSETPPHRQ